MEVETDADNEVELRIAVDNEIELRMDIEWLSTLVLLIPDSEAGILLRESLPDPE